MELMIEDLMEQVIARGGSDLHHLSGSTTIHPDQRKINAYRTRTAELRSIASD